MHILYIHQFFVTPAGSSGTRSWTFARRWVELGHRVTMLTGAVNGVPAEAPRINSVIDGIDVVQVGIDYRQEMSVAERKKSFLAFAMAASRIATTGIDRPDVIFASSTPLTVAIPALAARLRWRAPMVFEVRDLWPDAPIAFGALSPAQITIAKALERAAYLGSEAVVGLSPGMMEKVLERGADRARSVMLPNGVDRALYADPPDRAESRARFGLPADEFIVMYVGAIGPVHGIRFTLDAVRLAKERGVTGLRFVLVGEGAMQEEVEATATECPDHLTYLGAIQRRAVPAAFAACDVTLTTVSDEPILRTTCSNKLFDAMGAGRPQIVNLPGWNTDVVLDNDIGYAAAPGSGAALLDAALEARSDPDRAQKGASAARTAGSFEREAFAEQLEVLLRDVATHRGGAVRRAVRRMARAAR